MIDDENLKRMENFLPILPFSLSPARPSSPQIFIAGDDLQLGKLCQEIFFLSLNAIFGLIVSRAS